MSFGHILDLPMREHLVDGQGAIVEIEIVPLQRKRFAYPEAKTPANEHREVVRLRERLKQRLEVCRREYDDRLLALGAPLDPY
jgi:hypothetical protein